MKTELLALIENYGKALVHQTEGKISAFKDAKNLMSNIVFLLDKAEQEEAAELRRLHARIIQLESDLVVQARRTASEANLLNEVNAQLCEQNDSVGKACAELEAELVREAQRTAAEKLRADQMTEQHRMQSAMNAEARGELAQLREKRQPLSDGQRRKILDKLGAYAEGIDGETWDQMVVTAIEAAHNITGEPT